MRKTSSRASLVYLLRNIVRRGEDAVFFQGPKERKLSYDVESEKRFPVVEEECEGVCRILLTQAPAETSAWVSQPQKNHKKISWR